MGEIDIRNLHYAYPPLTAGGAPIPVLRGVDLAVERGEFLSIMGPTGVGKTTLCLALNGIIPQSTGGFFEGKVAVGGLDTTQCPVPTLAARVGVVFQDPESQFFNMTVEDEVAFGPETLGLPPAEIHERVDWALDVVRMADLRDRSPFQLSGGQKQRVAIAAILAMRPAVLVLDEPTSGLDPRGKAEVIRAIRELKERERITIILVEQEAEVIAEFSDRVAVLHEGRVALVDTPRAVFGQVNRLREIGVAAPQVSELAARLNARAGAQYAFTRLDEAYSELRKSASGQSLSPSLPLSPSPSPIIQVHDLCYRYADDITALKGINLEIAAGEFTAVIGQNGSGKTTLVKHFNGLCKPTRGRVLVDGRDTRGLAVGELARTVGYVFQNPDHQICATSVRAEIAFGPRNLGLRGEELAARVEETLDFFGLRAHAEAPPAVLGYGVRRKIGVAAVYAMRPRVFVLDEPTAGLDWRSARELMEAIRALNKRGHTIILVTHDMKLVCEFARRSLVLRDGELLLDGETRAVFEQVALLRESDIEPPQITALSQRLGQPRAALTVDEFCAAWGNAR